MKKIFLFCLAAIFLSACISEKKLVYFQKSAKYSDTIAITKVYVPKIQQGDVLSIYVNSLSPEASSFFNPYTGSNVTPTGQTSSQGFLVDPNGIIQLPLIGNIKVSGLTTSQVRDTIRTLLVPYLKEPTVLVRFLNFKISVLGEISRPEVYNITNERITLPEAISMAGDLTIYARRDSVQIIREENGKKEFGYVNLNTREIFNSPYYYLHANDIVYIKPAKTKAQQTDRSFQYISLGLSIVSLLFIIFKVN